MTNYAWNSKAKALRCPSCDEWVLVGNTYAGRMVCVSVCVVTPQDAIRHLGAKTKIYALDAGGGLFGPLGARDHVRMAHWRPAHPCGVPEVATTAARAPVADPCHFPPPVQPGFGCQRPTRSVTGCAECGPVPENGFPSEPGSDAASLLSSVLGAVVIERKVHDRVVWRDKRYENTR